VAVATVVDGVHVHVLGARVPNLIASAPFLLLSFRRLWSPVVVV